MYERFTERARNIMSFATQNSERLKHDYIDTEHILLGLLEEFGGVAAEVMKARGIDPVVSREKIERLLKPGLDNIEIKRRVYRPLAKKTLEYAIAEAQSMDHNYLGTEHILLGLLRIEDGLAAQVLKELNLNYQDTRKAVLEYLGQS